MCFGCDPLQVGHSAGIIRQVCIHICSTVNCLNISSCNDWSMTVTLQTQSLIIQEILRQSDVLTCYVVCLLGSLYLNRASQNKDNTKITPTGSSCLVLLYIYIHHSFYSYSCNVKFAETQVCLVLFYCGNIYIYIYSYVYTYSVVWRLIYLIYPCSSELLPGPLFTKRTELLSQDLVKSRSRKIWL